MIKKLVEKLDEKMKESSKKHIEAENGTRIFTRLKNTGMPEQEQNGVKMASIEAIKLLKNLFLEPIYFSTVCFEM